MPSSSVTDNIWHQTERAEQRDAPTPVTLLPQIGLLRISDRDPFDLIKRDLVTRAIVELGGARAFVRGHSLCVFECAAGFQIGRYAGRAEGMAPNFHPGAEVR